MTKLTKQHLKHIHEVIKLNESERIVLVDTTAEEFSLLSSSECNANIYCVNDLNEIIWQVDSAIGIKERDSFVYMEVVEGRLQASRFFGNEYEIDIKSGVAKQTGWHK